MGSNATIWETPFTYARCLSVGLVMEPDGDHTALLVLAPEGLDQHPKYVARFSRVFAVTCGEEAGFVLELGQKETEHGVRAHIWNASPHAAAYARTAFGYGLDVRHYVVFGDDNFCSIVAGAPPVIEMVPKPTEIQVRYAV